MPIITRSTGIFFMGYNPGGGYSGATENLDALVVQAAEMLAAEYGMDIEIRFNSDRMSGGAWLKTPAKPDQEDGMVQFSSTDVELGGWLRPDGAIVVQTYISKEFAAHPEAMMHDYWSGGNPKRLPRKDYDSRNHETLELGLQFLRENVKMPEVKICPSA